MSNLNKNNQQLMKTVYVERLGELVPHLLRWFQIKQVQVEDFHRINRQILTNVEKASQLTMKYLQYLLSFLSGEKTTARKLVEIKENHSILKIIQKQKVKKTSEQQDKSILELNQWNPTLLKFFDGLSQSTIQQRNLMKKFYQALQQLIDQFEKIQQNYKVFIKKHLKEILKKTEDIQENTKSQKKILHRYYDEQKKYSKDPVATISDVKQVEFYTFKQIDLIVARGKEIKVFIQQMIQYETAINNSFKQRFGVFISGDEAIFKLTNRMMALPKLIQRIDKQQNAIKNKYFDKNLVSETTLVKIKTFCGFLQSDSLSSVYKYLLLPSPALIHMFDIQKAIKQFVDHVVFRQWDLQLSQGWIIQSWTKCRGYITLNNMFILFGDNYKPLRTINTQHTKLESRQDNVVLLNQGQKGIFGTSSEEYKIKFNNKDALQEFQLYLDNKIS